MPWIYYYSLHIFKEKVIPNLKSEYTGFINFLKWYSKPISGLSGQNYQGNQMPRPPPSMPGTVDYSGQMMNNNMSKFMLTFFLLITFIFRLIKHKYFNTTQVWRSTNSWSIKSPDFNCIIDWGSFYTNKVNIIDIFPDSQMQGMQGMPPGQMGGMNYGMRPPPPGWRGPIPPRGPPMGFGKWILIICQHSKCFDGRACVHLDKKYIVSINVF